MAITYEDVTPSLIENTTMRKSVENGVDRAYYITPCEGYAIRDSRRDWVAIDEETNKEYTIPVYASGTVSITASYDFTLNPREIYAVLKTELPDGSEIF